MVKAPAPCPLDKGLFTEGAFQVPPAVMNGVLSVNLGQVIPTPYSTILANNPIDKWVAKGIPGSVRLYFGRGPGAELPTTNWLRLGSVTVFDPVDNKTSTVMRWWEEDVKAAQKDAIAKIAARYDGLIHMIFIANGGTTYAEPFIRGISSAVTKKALLDAGYTKEADQASYVDGYNMFKAFKVTRLCQAFNPWQYITPPNGAGVDVDFTIKMMDLFCKMFPRRAVLQNNSIRVPVLSPVYQKMYDHMKLLHDTTGRAIRFQTATKARIGDYPKTLDWAIGYGAHAVELSPGFQDCRTQPCLPPSQQVKYDAALRSIAG